jgi:riboflavin synthase
MFSGIVEELGEVRNIAKRANITLLEIGAEKVLKDTVIGDSVAVNGTCLTVVKKGQRSLGFEVIPETIKVSNLGILKVSDKVNLERSLKIGDRLSGHCK